MAIFSVLCFSFLVFCMNNVGEAETVLDSMGRQPEPNPSKNVRSQQKCISERCFMELKLGQPLIWSDECSRTSMRYACTFTIYLSYSENYMSIAFQSIQDSIYLITDGITEYLAQTSQHMIQPINSFSMFSIQYMCLTDVDECDKKFLEANFANFTKDVDDNSIRNKLSNLLYTSNPQVKQCYTSSSELTDCLDGYCSYGYFLGHARTPRIPQPPSHPTCKLTTQNTQIQITYINPQVIKGPIQYHDFVTFTCNKDKCNSPKNIDAVMQIFRNTNMGVGRYGGWQANLFTTTIFICFVWSLLF
jgi:hypothetical protein